MDLWDVAKVMWRRRWVAVPLLLLSAVAAVFALLTVPPDYTAKGQVAFLPPTLPVDSAKTGEPGNQFTVGTLAEFLSISLSRLEVREQMERDGLSGDYEITMKAFNLPLMDLKVVGKSAEEVTATIDHLISMVEAEVSKLQGHLKSGQAITSRVMDRGDEITVVRTVGKRTLIVIVGVGLIVTVAVSLWVDALIRRRDLRLPELHEARAAVPVSPAVGLASAAPPVVFSPNAANAATVSLEEGSPDNDSTVVLPLAGVAWSNGKAKGQPGKRNSGDAPGGAKTR